MNLIRATLSTKDGWREMRLLDLDIVVGGVDVEEILRQVEHALVSEYALAVSIGKTPFVEIFNAECPDDVRRAWEEDHKQFRQLNLPQEVRLALAAVFREPKIGQFRIEPMEPVAA